MRLIIPTNNTIGANEMQEYYTYTNEAGKEITVWIKEDCGLVNGLDRQWHKVVCKPIGFNNCPSMILDKGKLKVQNESR
jgi:hypothetical protein